MKSVFAFFALFLLLPLAKPEVSANAGQNISQQQTEQKNMQEWNALLETVGKAAYFLIWPLVALAGLAMDNNLVYGSFMQLDAPLWKIWTIVRNLANLTLWFLFLAWVLIFALNPQWKVDGILKGISKPQDLIKKALIAGVLIQASWFIMLVLVDVSTVMTYTIGTIPQSILPSVDQKVDHKVMGMSLALDAGDAGTAETQAENEAMKFYRTLNSPKGETLAFAPCELLTRKDEKSDYIIGRRYERMGDIVMQEGYCVHRGELVAYKEWNGKSPVWDIWPGVNGFSARLKNAHILLPNMGKDVFYPYVQKGYFLPISRETKIVAQNQDGCPVGFVSNAPMSSDKQGDSPKYACLFQDNGLKVSELLTKAKSRTGPFVSLYSSMLDFASFQNNHLWLSQKFIVFLINTGFAVVLLLPLVALVAVLFWRVAQLWIAIALSPFLVLKHSFKEMFGSFFENIDGLNLGELVKLLFAPVMIGFAVSVAMMFMTILKTSLAPSVQNLYIAAEKNQELSADQKKRNVEYSERIKDITGIEFKGEGDNQELEILGFIKISIKSGLMNFTWFLVQIFWLAISWFLLFAAIKSTKIGKKVWESLQKIGEKALATTPIIPVGKDGISFAWAQGAVNKVFTDINSKFDDQRNTEVQALLGDDTAKDKMLARDFFNGSKISYDFSTASNPEDKVRLLSTFVNIAGNDEDKKRKIGLAYEGFFTALNSGSSGLSDKEKTTTLMNLLNSEWMKKIGKADEYFAKFGQNLPNYIEETQDPKDSNKKITKKMILKMNPQTKEYEIVEDNS